jgi:hypothetical protein
MKPTAVPHLMPLAAWRQPKKRDAVLDRIQTITRELEALQAEMNTHLATPAGPKKNRFFEDPASVEALGRLKAELDQLRGVLWLYIEEAAQKPVTGIDTEQARRVERVTGLLSALSPLPGATTSGAEQSGSFFERLNVVIDTYMQEKKPAEADSKIVPPSAVKASS